MEMAGMWRAFADAAGPAAVSALWQGAAVALGLAFCLRLTPRIAAADRFRAWAAGFAALAALPFLPHIFSLVDSFSNTAAAGSVGSLPAAAAAHTWLHHPILDLDPRWSLAIATVWVAVSLARTVDLGVHMLRLRRLWKRAVPIEASEVNASLASPAELCTTRDLDRPSVIGFFAPRILIPEWLLERLTPEEMEQVVLHEAEHLRRRDDWINLLQKLCLVIFPLNPALAWMERRLCREREIACDEGVVRRTQAPRAYAACLASLAERRLERQHGLKHRAEALSLGAWQRRPELVDRVHRILRRGPGLHPAVARVLLGAMSCGLVFGAVELARCPQVVGFAAPPAVIPAAAAMQATAMVDGRPMRGFRAVDTVAHVPTRAELAAARLAHRQRTATEHRVRWSSTLATRTSHEDGVRSVLAKADLSRRPAAEVASTSVVPAAQPQQWIVYTEWEQVESSSSGPAANHAAPSPARQYTVTQLILRVYPAGAASNSQAYARRAHCTTARAAATRTAANRTGADSNTDPMAPLPAAIPIRDGWLVIQL